MRTQEKKFEFSDGSGGAFHLRPGGLIGKLVKRHRCCWQIHADDGQIRLNAEV